MNLRCVLGRGGIIAAEVQKRPKARKRTRSEVQTDKEQHETMQSGIRGVMGNSHGNDGVREFVSNSAAIFGQHKFICPFICSTSNQTSYFRDGIISLQSLVRAWSGVQRTRVPVQFPPKGIVRQFQIPATPLQRLR